MPTYRKKPIVSELNAGPKPVVIEAFQLPPLNAADPDPDLVWYVVVVNNGVMAAEPGDYIIKGVKGEYYPCKPDIFESTYEPAD